MLEVTPKEEATLGLRRCQDEVALGELANSPNAQQRVTSSKVP